MTAFAIGNRRRPAAVRGAEDDLRRVVRAGLVGSVLLLLGSLGSGAMPVYDPVRHTPVLTLLRQGAGERIALAGVYTGLAVLALAWLCLGRAIRRGEAGTTVSDLRRIAALWAAPLLVAVPLFSRDLYSYAAQAQLTHAGIDPYTHGPAALPGPFFDEIDRMWVDTPAPYGPLWLTLGRAVATLTGGHVLVTVFAMRLLAVGGVLLMARYLPRLAAACGADPRGALWLGLLNPLVLTHFVAGGHNDALMLGLLIAGVTIAVEAVDERGLAGGVVLATLAGLVKAPAAIAVAFIVPLWAARLAGRRALPRAALRVGLVALATFGLATVASGLGLGWARVLNAPGAVVAWVSVPTGLGLLTDVLRGAHNFVTSADTTIAVFRVVGQVAAVGVVVALWLRTRRGDPSPAGAVRALMLALVAIVLLGPVVQPWYVVWPVALAAAVGLPHRGWLLAAGGSVWLSMMTTPEGENLFLTVWPVLTTALASAVAAATFFGHEPEPGESAVHAETTVDTPTAGALTAGTPAGDPSTADVLAADAVEVGLQAAG